jgi:FkbM family methyltransferase
MHIKQFIKNKIKQWLASRGYALYKNQNGHDYEPTIDGAFKRLLRRNIPIQTVIDIGASDGSWSAKLMQFLPLAHYFLVEAQPVHQKALEQFCGKKKNIEFILAAASDKKGKLYFDTSDPLGGLASDTPFQSHCIEVPATTIDHEISKRALQKPFLLKLDTHGFERPILEGAHKTLPETEIIIIECYNFRIAPTCLLFHEICDYLKGFEFRCIDIFDPIYRLHDHSFWQMDMVFIKANRSEFLYQKYA